MGKILLWVVVIVGMLLLTRILSHHNAKVRHKARTPRSGPQKTMQAPNSAEPMVRCAHCSIHLPRSEAVLSKGQTWCCTEHARLGAGPHSPTA